MVTCSISRKPFSCSHHLNGKISQYDWLLYLFDLIIKFVSIFRKCLNSSEPKFFERRQCHVLVWQNRRISNCTKFGCLFIFSELWVHEKGRIFQWNHMWISFAGFRQQNTFSNHRQNIVTNYNNTIMYSQHANTCENETSKPR